MKQSLFGAICWLLISLIAFAASPKEKDTDKTLSPYFFVKSDNPELDQLPLKSTDVEVDIAGVIASVTVKQVYSNTGKNPIEAIYTFPASTKAAVYGMKMTIGERTIVAEIQEKQKARANYEQAKQEGKRASLLEQQRPNVFQMNVANIMPNDEIEVELKYTELLVPEEGTYEFVYPTVVGPRYSNDKVSEAPTNDTWVENPYLKEGEKSPTEFRIKTNVSAGLPIQQLTSSSHEVAINYTGKDKANVELNKVELYSGNRDYVLRYQLKGKQIESGMLLFESEKESYFLMMMQPPKRIEAKQIPAREYIFVVDVSGSMRGYPLDISKQLLKDLIGKLRPKDKFNVLLFAGGNQVMEKTSISATKANIKKAITWITNQRGGGGTELLPAMKQALAMSNDRDVSRNIIVVTDGYVTVEKEAFDLIRNNLNNANVFTFGIGTSVNRFIIEGMAYVGQGEPFIVLNQGEAPAKAAQLRKYIEQPVLTNIDLKFKGLDVYDVSQPTIPDVFADRPVLVYGKYKGKAKGSVQLTGRTGGEKYQEEIVMTTVDKGTNNEALQYLWARDRIKILGDYNKLGQDDKRVKEITEIGLNYNLLTDYTSFIAIDNQVVNKDGKSTTVKQPLPLPEGVSNSAVGNPPVRSRSPNAYSTQSYSPRKKSIDRKFNFGTPPPAPPAPVMIEEVTEELEMEDIESPTTVPIEKEKLTESKSISTIFKVVEKMPEFKGGDKEMVKFINKHLKYPAKAKADGIAGQVILTFVVNEDGSLSDIKILKGVHKLLDKEALRVVNMMPNWEPGRQRGKAVKVKYTLPFSFKL